MTETHTAIEREPEKLTEKQLILIALRDWIGQRPGLDPRNYISSWNDTEGRKAYNSEVRSITTDLHHARELLRYVEIRDSITAEMLKKAFKRGFSGRLSWTRMEDGRHRLDYCTGQYWPTEYRRAVCAVLAAACWEYFRENMPEPNPCEEHEARTYRGMTAGDYLRKTAAGEFPRAIARRWFQ